MPRARKRCTIVKARDIFCFLFGFIAATWVFSFFPDIFETSRLLFEEKSQDFREFFVYLSPPKPVLGRENARQKDEEDAISRLNKIRLQAEKYWVEGRGFIWFQHMRKAGGTSICNTLYFADGITFTGHHVGCMPTPVAYHDIWRVFGDAERLLAFLLYHEDRDVCAQEYGPLPADSIIRNDRGFERFIFWTNFRHPTSRIVSHIRYSLQGCQDKFMDCLHGRVNLKDQTEMNPEWEFGNNPDYGAFTLRYFDNYYTRMLSGNVNSNVTMDDLNKAKLILHRFSIIIITESFDETYQCVTDKLGIPLRESRHANKHEGGTFYLSRTQEQEFEKKNRYDFELYEYAVQLSKISCANGPKDYHPTQIQSALTKPYRERYDEFFQLDEKRQWSKQVWKKLKLEIESVEWRQGWQLEREEQLREQNKYRASSHYKDFRKHHLERSNDPRSYRWQQND